MSRYTTLSVRFSRAYMLHRAARRRAFSALGLWHGQLPILDYVDEHPLCSQSAMARTLGLSAPSVAISTKRLVKAGLLEKRADPDNLRQNRLSLTAHGERTVRLARELAEETNRALFSVLTDGEQQTLLYLLDRLIGEQDGAAQDTPLANYILKQKLEKEDSE